MKRKVLFIIVFTLIIVIWAILVCYSFNKHQQEKIIKEDETKIILRQRNIPYGVTLTYQEIIAMLTNNNELNKNAIISLVINGKDIEENENYKFQSIGENNITLNIYYPQFKLCKNRLKLSLKWLVIDDEAPIIEEFSDIQVVVGTEIDFNNYIIAKEASGERIPITIEGDYNLAIPGVYELNVKATNAGGISTEKKFRLIVGQKEEPTTTTSITTTKKTTTKSTTKKTTTKKNNND